MILDFRKMGLEALAKYCTIVLKHATDGEVHLESQLKAVVTSAQQANDIRGMRTIARDFKEWSSHLPPNKFFVLEAELKEAFATEETLLKDEHAIQVTAASSADKNDRVKFQFEIRDVHMGNPSIPLLESIEGSLKFKIKSADFATLSNTYLLQFAIILRKWLDQLSQCKPFSYVDGSSSQLLKLEFIDDKSIQVSSALAKGSTVISVSALSRGANRFLEQFNQALMKEIGVSIDQIEDEIDDLNEEQ
jgi:hypothetical protein